MDTVYDIFSFRFRDRNFMKMVFSIVFESSAASLLTINALIIVSSNFTPDKATRIHNPPYLICRHSTLSRIIKQGLSSGHWCDMLKMGGRVEPLDDGRRHNNLDPSAILARLLENASLHTSRHPRCRLFGSFKEFLSCISCLCAHQVSAVQYSSIQNFKDNCWRLNRWWCYLTLQGSTQHIILHLWLSDLTQITHLVPELEHGENVSKKKRVSDLGQSLCLQVKVSDLYGAMFHSVLTNKHVERQVACAPGQRKVSKLFVHRPLWWISYVYFLWSYLRWRMRMLAPSLVFSRE